MKEDKKSSNVLLNVSLGFTRDKVGIVGYFQLGYS